MEAQRKPFILSFSHLFKPTVMEHLLSLTWVLRVQQELANLLDTCGLEPEQAHSTTTISSKQGRDNSPHHGAHSLEVGDSEQINERDYLKTQKVKQGWGKEMCSLREVEQERCLSDLKNRRSLRARICERASEVSLYWNRLCGGDSRNAYYGSAVIIIFIVMSTSSHTSKIFMPVSSFVHTDVTGAEGRTPWRPALRGHPKQVLCVPARIHGAGGAAMRAGPRELHFP